MARAQPSTKSYITDSNSFAPGRSRRNATRLHLRTQLHRLDVQIDALMYAQSHDAWRTLERAAWIQPAAAKIVWTGRLELYYLTALREALLETLTHL